MDMVRGVKNVVNSSDVLCINGIDVAKLVNQLVNNSFELVRMVEGRGREKEERLLRWARFAEQSGGALKSEFANSDA